MSIGDSPESSSQAMVVGMMLVGGLGVEVRERAQGQFWGLSPKKGVERRSLDSCLLLSSLFA